MTEQQIAEIKKTNGYTAPTQKPCRECRHCFAMFSLQSGEEAACGINGSGANGRFAVHPWVTCERFEIRPHLLKERP